MTRAQQIVARLLEAAPDENLPLGYTPDEFQRRGLDQPGAWERFAGKSTPEEIAGAAEARKRVNAPSSATQAKKPRSPHYPAKEYTPPSKPIDLKDYLEQESNPEVMADRLRTALFAVELQSYLPTKVHAMIGEDDATLAVELHLIDNDLRLGAQGHVIPPPYKEGWEMQRFYGWLTRVIRAAVKRAKMPAINLEIEEVVPAHDGLAISQLPDDFEDDIGDWIVRFNLH